jgi:two-component system response regulator FlrC
MQMSEALDLFWDNAESIDPNTMAVVTAAGLRPRPILLANVAEVGVSDKNQPLIICVSSRSARTETQLKAIRARLGVSAYIVLRVAENDVQTAVIAIKCGIDEVVTEGRTAALQWQSVAKSARIRLLKRDSFVFVDLNSQRLLALVERVGASEVNLLLQGPTGVGKEVLARLAHDFSPRRNGPFIPVNCAALPETLAESLLFGHAKGSFTGASQKTDGVFSQADGGTLFLDEIGELPLSLQAKLLRVIQEKEVVPVGASEARKVDVRIVSATNRDLRTAVRDRSFREDLYFRVSTFNVAVPGLSVRKDDILPLANFFVLKHGQESEPAQISPNAAARLLSHTWPGNVRELENVIQRALVLITTNMIDESHLLFDEPLVPVEAAPEPILSDAGSAPVTASNSTNDGLKDSLDANEFRIIADTLSQYRTRQEAAAALGISERTLRYKIAKMRERGVQMPNRRAALG